jgi:xanthine dehydrogenase YagT iron-sulfur-binding subunit
MRMETVMSSFQMTRRELVEGAAAALIAGLPDAVTAAESAASGSSAATLRVNGNSHRIELDSRATLLDTLRERLALTGTKKGCDRGECGACTVHIDGRRVLSCMTLAVMVEGKEVTTIEGLASAGSLHPVQAAFIEHDAFQCGYCTPGQIMSAVACIREGHVGSDDEIREFMSGNICRCSAYPQIVAAVRASAGLRGV